MKDISIHITNESLDLLEKQTTIINKREAVKSQINSYIEITDEKQSAKMIEKAGFSEIPESSEIIDTINGKIQEIINSQATRKKITEQATATTKQIEGLKGASKFIVFIIIIAAAVAAYFYFKNH